MRHGCEHGGAAEDAACKRTFATACKRWLQLCCTWSELMTSVPDQLSHYAAVAPKLSLSLQLWLNSFHSVSPWQLLGQTQKLSV